MSFRSEMQQLSIIAGIVARHGHRVVTESKTHSGHCGDVKFGIDAGGSYIELNGKRMSDDDAKTLVANLMNALEQVEYMGWEQEHFKERKVEGDDA